MADYIDRKIGDGIELICVNADRFKTNEIAISLALPLKKETAAVNALLAGLLTRKSSMYPDIASLNRKLAHIYGASLSGTVSKISECQVVKLGITCLDDRFSLDGESISFEGLELLVSLLFSPKLDENGEFFDEDIESEKRILIEKIESEENEKRTYVLRQTEKEMFDGEPYAVNRFGTVEDIKKITKNDVRTAWTNLLSGAKIMITVVGNADAEKICACIEDKFSRIERSYSPLPEAVFVPEAKNVKDKTERIEVKQGKLVLGFRVNMKPGDELTAAMRTFCDVFGGGPYSKLFTNVREKMSLCYYCSARYTRLKSFIMIQCGCTEENMDKAVNEILNQLEIIKNGDFDEEFASSKMALRDAILSVNDASEGLESWYASQIADDKAKSPEESAKENDAVTKEQVQKCASLITLDTIYRLASVKEGE